MTNRTDERVTFIECRRCGHEWIPRKNDVRQCPKCKTAYWELPKSKRTE